MKVWNSILKFLATLAAILGIVYVAVTYGDKIIAWTKRKLNQYGLCCCDCGCEEEIECEECSEEIAEETVAEESDFEG